MQGNVGLSVKSEVVAFWLYLKNNGISFETSEAFGYTHFEVYNVTGEQIDDINRFLRNICA